VARQLITVYGRKMRKALKGFTLMRKVERQVLLIYM
jgi:hypothetical protein